MLRSPTPPLPVPRGGKGIAMSLVVAELRPCLALSACKAQDQGCPVASFSDLGTKGTQSVDNFINLFSKAPSGTMLTSTKYPWCWVLHAGYIHQQFCFLSSHLLVLKCSQLCFLHKISDLINRYFLFLIYMF